MCEVAIDELIVGANFAIKPSKPKAILDIFNPTNQSIQFKLYITIWVHI